MEAKIRKVIYADDATVILLNESGEPRPYIDMAYTDGCCGSTSAALRRAAGLPGKYEKLMNQKLMKEIIKKDNEGAIDCLTRMLTID
jgi:hypothetical protein